MYIQFHTQRKVPDKSFLFHLNNTSVQRVEYAKLLGHFIDDKLNWNIHVNYICSKLNSAIFVLYQMRDRFSESSLFFVYYGYVYNKLKDAIVFWGSHANHLDRLFKIQKRSLRTIKKFKTIDSCVPIFTELEILTVPCIYILDSIMFRREHPELYTLNKDLHSYNTRNNQKSAVAAHSSNIVKKSPHYNSSKMFDNLPLSMRKLKSDELFKNLLKKILIFKIYYRVEMFYNNDTKILIMMY
jgi:hypothetical protein